MSQVTLSIPSFLSNPLKLLKTEPVVLLSLATAISAFILHQLKAPATTTSYALAAVVAGFHLIAAVVARPVSTSVLHGAVVTFLAAVAPYWLHIGASQLQAFTTLIVAGLGLVLRQNLTPTANSAPVTQSVPDPVVQLSPPTTGSSGTATGTSGF